MSKNFEKEYIALTEIEVPDLWDRIEAGLTPRSAQGSKENKKENTQQKPLLYFFKKYKTVLAAAVCVIVILPAAIVLGRMDIGFGSAKEECAAADTAAPESMEYAVVTEAEEAPAQPMEFAEETAAEEIFNEAAEEYEAEEYARAEEAAEEEYEAAKEAGVEDGFSESAAEYEKAATTESAEAEVPAELADEKDKAQSMTEGERTEAAKGEETAVVTYLDVEDGTVLTYVKVRVYGSESLPEEGETKGMGNLYRAEVLEDADDLLKQGEEILIYISPLSSLYWPDEEAVYDVMLEYDSTREYPFYLKSCY